MGKWLVISLLALSAGCSSDLESGYKPKKLGVSDAERRGYYASPFSPEAHAGEEAHREDTGQTPQIGPGM